MKNLIKKEEDLLAHKGCKNILGYINLNLSQIDTSIAKNTLSEIAHTIRLAKDFKEPIISNEQYILNIPKYIKKGLKSGKYSLIRKSDTGEALATVSHNVDGKVEFYKNLTVKKVLVKNDRTKQRILSDRMYQLAIQQQITEICLELKDIRNEIKCIERGQENDRFAKIDSARLQLELATKATKQENQIAFVHQAILPLTEGYESIKRTLKDKINMFKKVPIDELSIYKEMFLCRGNYKKKKDKAISGINEHFNFLLAAQNLLIYANLILGEFEIAKKILEKQNEFMSTIDLSNIKTINYLYPDNSLENEWYINPQRFIKDNQTRLLESIERNYDFVSIHVNGKQLLEALGNEEIR